MEEIAVASGFAAARLSSVPDRIMPLPGPNFYGSPAFMDDRAAD
jgi:hypothetical protein